MDSSFDLITASPVSIGGVDSPLIDNEEGYAKMASFSQFQSISPELNWDQPESSPDAASGDETPIQRVKFDFPTGSLNNSLRNYKKSSSAPHIINPNSPACVTAIAIDETETFLFVGLDTNILLYKPTDLSRNAEVGVNGMARQYKLVSEFPNLNQGAVFHLKVLPLKSGRIQFVCSDTRGFVTMAEVIVGKKTTLGQTSCLIKPGPGQSFDPIYSMTIVDYVWKSQKGKYMVLSRDKNQLQVWSLNRPSTSQQVYCEVVEGLSADDKGEQMAICATQDGEKLQICIGRKNELKMIYLSPAQGFAILPGWNLAMDLSIITALVFSPNGKFLLVFSFDNTVFVLDSGPQTSVAGGYSFHLPRQLCSRPVTLPSGQVQASHASSIVPHPIPEVGQICLLLYDAIFSNSMTIHAVKTLSWQDTVENLLITGRCGSALQLLCDVWSSSNVGEKQDLKDRILVHSLDFFDHVVFSDHKNDRNSFVKKATVYCIEANILTDNLQRCFEGFSNRFEPLLAIKGLGALMDVCIDVVLQLKVEWPIRSITEWLTPLIIHCVKSYGPEHATEVILSLKLDFDDMDLFIDFLFDNGIFGAVLILIAVFDPEFSTNRLLEKSLEMISAEVDVSDGMEVVGSKRDTFLKIFENFYFAGFNGHLVHPVWVLNNDIWVLETDINGDLLETRFFDFFVKTSSNIHLPLLVSPSYPMIHLWRHLTRRDDELTILMKSLSELLLVSNPVAEPSIELLLFMARSIARIKRSILLFGEVVSKHNFFHLLRVLIETGSTTDGKDSVSRIDFARMESSKPHSRGRCYLSSQSPYREILREDAEINIHICEKQLICLVNYFLPEVADVDYLAACCRERGFLLAAVFLYEFIGDYQSVVAGLLRIDYSVGKDLPKVNLLAFSFIENVKDTKISTRLRSKSSENGDSDKAKPAIAHEKMVNNAKMLVETFMKELCRISAEKTAIVVLKTYASTLQDALVVTKSCPKVMKHFILCALSPGISDLPNAFQLHSDAAVSIKPLEQAIKIRKVDMRPFLDEVCRSGQSFSFVSKNHHLFAYQDVVSSCNKTNNIDVLVFMYELTDNIDSAMKKLEERLVTTTALYVKGGDFHKELVNALNKMLKFIERQRFKHPTRQEKFLDYYSRTMVITNSVPRPGNRPFLESIFESMSFALQAADMASLILTTLMSSMPWRELQETMIDLLSTLSFQKSMQSTLKDSIREDAYKQLCLLYKGIISGMRLKANVECMICGENMDVEGEDLIVFRCFHLYHLNCLQQKAPYKCLFCRSVGSNEEN